MNYIPSEIKSKIELARKNKLKELDLSYKTTCFKLEEIPPEIFELTQLEILNLRNNEIAEIPREILRLRKLKALNLIDNKLETIPNCLSKLPDLKSVCLTFRANN